MTTDQQLIKSPYEDMIFHFDFGADLEEGASLLPTPLPTPTATPVTVPPLVITDCVVSSPRVQATYKGGKGGTAYHVKCQAPSTTKKLELCGTLYVEDC